LIMGRTRTCQIKERTTFGCFLATIQIQLKARRGRRISS
jgi:hypothetical protein